MKLSEEAIEAANSISASLDAEVFVYSGAIDFEGFRRLVSAMQPSNEQPPRQNLILFLTTYGGNAGEAYRIARLLQATREKFSLCVPSICKSAGTLIALGATEIYMPLASELGPLDVQLWRRDEIGQRRSGMVVRTALDGLGTETFKVFKRAMYSIMWDSKGTIGFDVASRVAATIATGVMAPVYQQIDPESLGNDLRDLSIATAYGERLAGHGGNATAKTVRYLVEDYPTHDFIIDREEAQSLFTKVHDTTDEMNVMISELGELAHLPRDPSVVLRVDIHASPENEPGGTDASENNGENARANANDAGVAQAVCQEDRRSDCKGRPTEGGIPQTHTGSGETTNHA